jgi:hypothetical protein
MTINSENRPQMPWTGSPLSSGGDRRHVGVALADGCTFGDSGLDSSEFGLRQLDVFGGDVLLEVAAPLRPRDRNDVLAAAEHPWPPTGGCPAPTDRANGLRRHCFAARFASASARFRSNHASIAAIEAWASSLNNGASSVGTSSAPAGASPTSLS